MVMEAATYTAQSLYVVYRQMPVAVQEVFKQLLEEEEDNSDGWLRLTEETLREDWEAPENDVWDKFYAEQRRELPTR
ncbi:hypothetical protein AWR27_16710 [Spirosoma montaniterrae]|uniref:Uncharacterized protein n=2 Tax=Spirosoma montaniterrae TaxID=1178516 RepID=A0A1P9WZM2_9BACT|nr:hypothetical protein AWR27_16710 [Spirosoma montaniterrae]